MCLQSMQCGLSWTIVMKKSADIRAAFAGFDLPTVASMTEKDVERMLTNGGPSQKLRLSPQLTPPT